MQTGDKFNRWTAVRFVERRGSNYFWLFRCSCGAEKVRGTSSVTSGNSRSCGCIRKEILATVRVGDVFTRLTAVRPYHEKPGGGYWLFRCICGTEHPAKIYEVRNGGIKSCGCLRDERRLPPIQIGDTFSDLTAVRPIDGSPLWLFKCSCGTECSPRPQRVVNGRIKSCGCRRSIYETSRVAVLESKKSRLTRMYCTRKRDSRLRGISFSISKSDIGDLAEQQGWRCARTGISLDLTASDGMKPFGPSLDRINNNIGYEPGNIQLVCYMYNSAKNQFTDEDVLRFASELLKHSSDTSEALKRAA